MCTRRVVVNVALVFGAARSQLLDAYKSAPPPQPPPPAGHLAAGLSTPRLDWDDQVESPPLTVPSTSHYRAGAAETPGVFSVSRRGPWTVSVSATHSLHLPHAAASAAVDPVQARWHSARAPAPATSDPPAAAASGPSEMEDVSTGGAASAATLDWSDGLAPAPRDTRPRSGITLSHGVPLQPPAVIDWPVPSPRRREPVPGEFDLSAFGSESDARDNGAGSDRAAPVVAAALRPVVSEAFEWGAAPGSIGIGRATGDAAPPRSDGGDGGDGGDAPALPSAASTIRDALPVAAPSTAAQAAAAAALDAAHPPTRPAWWPGSRLVKSWRLSSLAVRSSAPSALEEPSAGPVAVPAPADDAWTGERAEWGAPAVEPESGGAVASAPVQRAAAAITSGKAAAVAAWMTERGAQAPSVPADGSIGMVYEIEYQ